MFKLPNTGAQPPSRLSPPLPGSYTSIHAKHHGLIREGEGVLPPLGDPLQILQTLGVSRLDEKPSLDDSLRGSIFFIVSGVLPRKASWDKLGRGEGGPPTLVGPQYFARNDFFLYKKPPPLPVFTPKPASQQTSKQASKQASNTYG